MLDARIDVANVDDARRVLVMGTARCVLTCHVNVGGVARRDRLSRRQKPVVIDAGGVKKRRKKILVGWVL